MLDLKFLNAGNATFTIANPKGDRYTYKVKASKKLKRTFVYVLTGSNNETDYTYMGMLVFSDFKLTQASKYCLESLPVKVFNYALELIKGRMIKKPGYFLEHNGCCARCGRKLTTPESIKAGLGPICRGKI